MEARSNYPDTKAETIPLARAARDRLRDTQHEETRRLAAVLAAQERLSAERSRAEAAITKAEHGIATRQAVLDEAVLDLIGTSGVNRTAILLDRSASDLVRLRRTRRGNRPKTKNVSRGHGPDVPA
jgi:hypothetical protein